MRRVLAFMLVALPTLLATPPATAPAPAKPKPKPGVPAFRDLADGLRVADLKEGKGEGAKPGQNLAVLYRGWLYDTAKGRQGALFDQAQDRKRPFTFPLGAGRVIRGWDEGLVGMKKGGKRVLFIPAPLAYGEREIKDGSRVVIPANSTLIFEVQLLEITGEPRLD